MASEPSDDPDKVTDPEAELDSAAEAVDAEPVDELPKIGDARMVEAIEMLNEHQGPLPSKEWLTTVEHLSPGTTKQLVDDYVAERGHQRTIQSEAVQIDRENFTRFSQYQTRQLLAAWSVVVLVAVGGIVLISLGESIVGFVTLISELAVLAGVFLGRQVIQSKSDGGPPTPQG